MSRSTIRTQALDDVKNMIRNSKPQVKTLPSMADLNFINPTTIKINDRGVALDSTAVKGLCNLLEMPSSFYNKLHNKNKQAWSSLTKALSEQYHRPVNLIASKGRVIAIVENLSDVTKHDEVLAAVSMVMKHDPTYTLKHVEFNGVDLQMHLLHKTDFDAGPWLKSKVDMFQQGVVIQNSIVDGFLARSVIERMVCSNLGYANIPGSEKQIEEIEKLPDFIERRDSTEIMNVITKRINILRKVNASLEEVVATSRILHDGDPHSDFMKQYIDQLRIGEISYAYGLTIEEALERPRLFRSTIKTPFILYDLHNWIAEIAKHDSRIPQSNVLKLRIHAGNLLFDRPDVLSVAPEKVISKKPWILSSRN